MSKVYYSPSQRNKMIHKWHKNNKSCFKLTNYLQEKVLSATQLYIDIYSQSAVQPSTV